jgi:chromate transporter
MDEPESLEHSPDQSSSRLREVFWFFLRLGFTAFGGPAVHVSMMEDELVTRRKWVDRQHFLDLMAAVNFIPGPNSTELAIHLGLIRAGIPGLIAAGVAFITPAMLIIMPIAWLYCAYGSRPQVEPAMRGISAAVVAIVFAALIRLLKPMRNNPAAIVIAIGSCAGAFALRKMPQLQPEILILLLAAIFGSITHRFKNRTALPMLSIALPGLLVLSGIFLKIGATLFGSGYVLVNYLQSNFVDQRHWLTQQQLLDAIAVGQFTPGPLLTTATFVGFVVAHNQLGGGNIGGAVGAVVATVSIFLPSFILVGLLAPVLQRLRQNTTARGALDGMNAAVVGLLFTVAIRLMWTAVRWPESGRADWINALILIAALICLLRGINATWLILFAGFVGVFRWYMQ